MSKQSKTSYVRTSKHTVKFMNTGKKDTYSHFINEMRKVAETYVDFLWNCNHQWTDKDDKTHDFCVDNLNLEVPQFFDYQAIPVDENCLLSARAKSSLLTQCLGLVKADTEKYRKRLFILDKLAKENKPIPFKLLENLVVRQPVKPRVNRINLELSSKNIDFKEVDGEFDMFMRLKSLGDFDTIKIPIKMHKQANKWKNKGDLKGSILLSEKSIDIRWEVERKFKTEGKTIGIDQGKSTILTFSDSQVTPDKDIHNHDLDSVMKKLGRKKKGSRSFRKAQDHRTNFINWSINQMRLDDVLTANCEELKNLYTGRKMSRYMLSWVYSVIDDKTMRYLEEGGVHQNLTPPTYKSQRCSECGWVHKSNRKGKDFFCSRCGSFMDADFNGAKNNEIDLYPISDQFRKLNLNRTTGFYWNSEGMFNENGEKLRVSLSRNEV